MNIYFALKLHGPSYRKVLTDKTSVKYTTKAGGTASVHLQDYVEKIQNQNVAEAKAENAASAYPSTNSS